MANRVLKAIHAKCVDCSGFSVKEVRECKHTWCPLYKFRMGVNPDRKRREPSAAAMAALAAGREIAHSKKNIGQ